MDYSALFEGELTRRNLDNSFRSSTSRSDAKGKTASGFSLLHGSKMDCYHKMLDVATNPYYTPRFALLFLFFDACLTTIIIMKVPCKHTLVLPFLTP